MIAKSNKSGVVGRLSRHRPCPCCSKLRYGDCCEPVIAGRVCVLGAEGLMRSRYTAYTLGIIKYIDQTQRGVAAQDFNIVSAKKWARRCDWRRLQVVFVEPWAAGQVKSTVEYVAFYELDDKPMQIHEKSFFECEDSQWYYVDGIMLPAVL